MKSILNILRTDLQPPRGIKLTILTMFYWILGGMIPIHIFTRTRRFIVDYQIIDYAILAVAVIVGIVILTKASRFNRTHIFAFSILAVVTGFIGLFIVPINLFPNVRATSLLIGSVELKPTSIPYGLSIVCTFGLNAAFSEQIKHTTSLSSRRSGSAMNHMPFVCLGLAIGSALYLLLLFLFESMNVVFPSYALIGSFFALVLSVLNPFEADVSQDESAKRPGTESEDASRTEPGTEPRRESKSESNSRSATDTESEIKAKDTQEIETEMNPKEKEARFTESGLARKIGGVAGSFLLAVFFVATHVGTLFFHSHYVDSPLEPLNLLYFTVNFIIGFALTAALYLITNRIGNETIRRIVISLPLVFSGLSVGILYYYRQTGSYNSVLWYVAGIGIAISFTSFLVHRVASNNDGIMTFFQVLAFTIGGYLVFVPIGGDSMDYYGPWLYPAIWVFSAVYPVLAIIWLILNAKMKKGRE